MKFPGWLRLLAIVCLMACVYCKMIDLDCALSNPAHCQSLLESNDNTFAHFELEQPLWTGPPVLIVICLPPAPQAVSVPVPMQRPPALTADFALVTRQSPLSKRPPPQAV
ncbi:MAG: hypothetical protein KF760_10005 [Candidatus Eremiobacteraeota bacterium]|nr:hypothetical protein [Candidatus Eremiobacteraeota bacterium]MCW5871257.1 hypothetical protein [Candidatus Eremiobacteraeota bacterium]